MKSLIVVGSNYDATKDLAKRLAEALSFCYFDVYEEFKKFLLDTANLPLILANDVLTKKEKEILEEVSKRENAVCSMKDDMFMSNGNFVAFKNNFVVLLKNQMAEPLELGVEKLISGKANLIIEEDVDFASLINTIKTKSGI